MFVLIDRSVIFAAAAIPVYIFGVRIVVLFNRLS